MPAKSRRKRGKNVPPGKRRKSSTVSSSAAVVAQPTVDKTESAAVETPVTAQKNVVQPAPAAVARYPYIFSELITIGLLAVLILVILGILAAVL